MREEAWEMSKSGWDASVKLARERRGEMLGRGDGGREKR